MKPSKENVRNSLIELAKARKLETYGDFYARFGFNSHGQNHPIAQHLGTIMRDEAAQGRPLLPTLIVNKDGDKSIDKLLPNDKYFESLAIIRRESIQLRGKGKTEVQRGFYKVELDAVFAYYATNSGVLAEPD